MITNSLIYAIKSSTFTIISGVVALALIWMFGWHSVYSYFIGGLWFGAYTVVQFYNFKKEREEINS